ncbi:hypothetical protein HWC80_gp089 [Mycobacterium phage Indlulamithi]|uniref:Uncharacterized protein n=1 Tax=Mycobacterium phage Indlulamithi TaxID=2656582 RepID=A0A649VEB5_9CAUD|nr:hypothetical protein HWC80_gp089 [Mycobacterium phage Indlulamithi]QGJ90123.1 hypothetical protein PBI_INDLULAMITHI_85 [Mycobacterium phage Indlulamithi]
MAIRVQCDNCEKILRNEPDDTGAEPEAHYVLALTASKGDKTIHPLQMDLCPRCAKRYFKVLKDPV